MAIYHCTVNPIGRSNGRSSTAAAAYRSASRIVDERTGEVHDYTRRRGVLHAEIVLPEGAPDWAENRSALWNAAEAAECKGNARVAREVEISLPHELDFSERRDLALEFARHLTERYGVAVDVALHAPHRDGDTRNFHAHLLMTTRELGPEGFGSKTRVLDDRTTGPSETRHIRKTWAEFANRALERHHIEARIDHRSYETQGLDREATQHLGPRASQMERRGVETDIGERNRAAGERNAGRAELHRQYEEITREIEAERRREEQARGERKAEITALWRRADSGRAFQAALAEAGYLLARGERRDFVVLDRDGGVHNVVRQIENAKTPEVRKRLADIDPDSLLTAEEAQAWQRSRLPEPVSPQQILDRLTWHQSVFSQGDLEQALIEAGHNPDKVRQRLEQEGGIVPLYDRETGEAAGLFTTPEVRRQEGEILARAVRMAAQPSHVVDARHIVSAGEARTLDEEQRRALEHALAPQGLTMIEGRAGTGKSHTINAIREAAEADGYRVIGLAPTNSVVSDMRGDGFRDARTVHSLLWHAERGRPEAALSRRTLLIVDEAAMMDSRILHRFLEHAGQAGAKVILVGDDRQLSSVQRGGMFTAIREQTGSAEIATVRRQREAWDRQASRDFAAGNFEDGLAAYDRHGRIDWQDDLDQAREALLRQWEKDTAQGIGERFVFAYTNEEVNRLNAQLRGVEIERGRVNPKRSVTMNTEKFGLVEVAEGDRIQFRSTDKRVGYANGDVATVKAVGRDGTVTVEAKDGRRISFQAWSKDAPELQHGYAGTIYRGQGKTLDDVYLLHTYHWRSRTAYVALTRAREAAQVYVGRDQARDRNHLVRQMSRPDDRTISLRFATADELARPVEREAPAPEPAERIRARYERERAALQASHSEQTEEMEAHWETHARREYEAFGRMQNRRREQEQLQDAAGQPGFLARLAPGRMKVWRQEVEERERARDARDLREFDDKMQEMNRQYRKMLDRMQRRQAEDLQHLRARYALYEREQARRAQYLENFRSVTAEIGREQARRPEPPGRERGMEWER